MRGSILFPFFRLLFFDLVGRFLELFELSLPFVLRRESPSKVFKGDGMRREEDLLYLYRDRCTDDNILPFSFIFRLMRGVHVGESGARTSGEPQVRQGDDLYKVRGG